MITKIQQIIQENNNFAILFHKSPDADAVGSAVGLGIVLKKSLGKNVFIFHPYPLEQKLAQLDPFHLIIKKLPDKGVDVVFLLDSSEKKRLAGIEQLDNFSYKISVNIDHHMANRLFGNINYVDTHSSSVGEMIYKIVNCWTISVEAAEALYAAILTDTGRFTFQNTTATTLKVASELVSLGANPSKLALQFYHNYPLSILKDIGRAFINAKVLMGGKVAILNVDSNANESIGDIVDFSLIVEGVEVSALLREKNPGVIEIALRSQSFFDVGELAVALGGGGHKNAAGCRIKASMPEAEKILLKEIKKRGL